MINRILVIILDESIHTNTSYYNTHIGIVTTKKEKSIYI